MSTMKKIRVLVVDDSAVIRAIIADSIAKQPDMEVAGIAHDGQQAVYWPSGCGPTLSHSMSRCRTWTG